MTSVLLPEDVLQRAHAIRAGRYADAEVVFASGSLLRSEGTPTSDLDLVVIYQKLPNAYRESFTFLGLPVEVFVHDPQTLEYFLLQVDRAAGIPALPCMVSEGVIIPFGSQLGAALKERAAALVQAGPPPLDAESIQRRRYFVTDLLDDLAYPRSIQELLGTATRLFEATADFYLRYHRRWSGRGKGLVRALVRADEHLAERFCAALHTAIVDRNPAALIHVTDEMLESCGGRLFDGLRVDAPAAWRAESTPGHKGQQ
jgi:hypothetical protein